MYNFNNLFINDHIHMPAMICSRTLNFSSETSGIYTNQCKVSQVYEEKLSSTSAHGMKDYLDINNKSLYTCICYNFIGNDIMN